MDQFRNATKSLGRDHSRKKPHGIFSQPPEESSDYESEDNNEQYKEYVGKSKVGKSKSSVSLLKDFLHLNSSHSISKSLKSKQGLFIYIFMIRFARFCEPSNIIGKSSKGIKSAGVK